MVPERAGDAAAPSAADAPVAPAVPAASVGGQIKAARVAKAMSVNDVARALKLSPRQVEAIEVDDWQALPCNTIIRGFVRNYARLLGLDSDRLMAELDRVTMPQAAELEVAVGTPVSMPSEGLVDRRDFIRVLAGLIVLLLAVSAYFFAPQDLWQSTVAALKSATQSAAVKPVRDEPAAAPAAAPATAPAPAAAPAADAPAGAASTSQQLPPNPLNPAPAAAAATAAPSAAAAAPATGAAPAAGAAALHFEFAQPSWVEVRDASGKVIFSKKNDAGTQRDVEGQPPFAVVVGNAGYVTLQYKGRSVDLSKRSKEDVARVTLE